MNALDHRTTLGRFAILCAIVVLPFLRFLMQNDYRLLRLEVGLAVLLLATVCGIAARACRRPWAFYAACVLAIVCLGATTVGKLLLPWAEIGVRWILLGSIVLLLALVYLLRGAFLHLVLVFSLGAFGVDVLQWLMRSETPRSTPAAQARGPLPHVVYVIFDEYGGPLGLPRECEECRAARRSIGRTFLDNGFILYAQSFANYWATFDSISSLLKRRLLDRTMDQDHRAPRNVLFQNRLFERFREQGYAIHTYQTDIIDFASPEFAVERVVRYPANSIGALNLISMPWPDRFQQIVGSYLQADPWIWDNLDRAGWRPDRQRVGPLSLKGLWPDGLLRDILTAERKTLFLAHLLTPHDPYLYDQNGRVKDRREWVAEHISGGGIYSREEYLSAYRSYAEQVIFLNRQIEEFASELKQRGVYDAITIVMHGDHGSRIHLRKPSERTARERLRFSTPKCRRANRYDFVSPPDPQELLDRFSNLMAVKPAGARAGRLDGRRGSAMRFLAEALYGEPEQVPGGADSLYLFDAEGLPVAIPMPVVPMVEDLIREVMP